VIYSRRKEYFYYLLFRILVMPLSFVMRRILGMEPKNRVQTRVSIEDEILVAIKVAGLDLNDTVNIALADRLAHRKYVVQASSETSSSILSST